jgi:hypothetical protein
MHVARILPLAHLCFLAGIGEVIDWSEHHRTHLNDTDIAFFD